MTAAVDRLPAQSAENFALDRGGRGSIASPSENR
jgi:hypothetical protein